jgi:hypothetical protein
LSCRVQTVQVRHTDIQQENVWFQLAGTRHGFTPVPGLATNLPSRMIFDQGANTLSRYLVIIRNKDSKVTQASPPRTRTAEVPMRLFGKSNFVFEEPQPVQIATHLLQMNALPLPAKAIE